MSELRLTEQEAISFFSEFYGGEHHLPGLIKPAGLGFVIVDNSGELATFDGGALTRLVLMAHHYCYRASVLPYTSNKVKIAIWKRQREGSMFERHPTNDQAIEQFNKLH